MYFSTRHTDSPNSVSIPQFTHAKRHLTLMYLRVLKTTQTMHFVHTDNYNFTRGSLTTLFQRDLAFLADYYCHT